MAHTYQPFQCCPFSVLFFFFFVALVVFGGEGGNLGVRMKAGLAMRFGNKSLGFLTVTFGNFHGGSL